MIMGTLTQIKQDKTLQLQISIIEAIVNGVIHTPSELAEQFNLTIHQAINILDDQAFLQTISKFSRGKANLHFHGKGIQRLIDMSEEEDSKIALSALKLLAQYTGNVKAKGDSVNVNFNLSELIDKEDKKEKDITPIEIDLKNL